MRHFPSSIYTGHARSQARPRYNRRTMLDVVRDERDPFIEGVRIWAALRGYRFHRTYLTYDQVEKIYCAECRPAKKGVSNGSGADTTRN